MECKKMKLKRDKQSGHSLTNNRAEEAHMKKDNNYHFEL